MLYLIRIFVVHLRCIENENTSGGMHSCIQLLTWTRLFINFAITDDYICVCVLFLHSLSLLFCSFIFKWTAWSLHNWRFFQCMLWLQCHNQHPLWVEQALLPRLTTWISAKSIITKLESCSSWKHVILELQVLCI